VLVADRENDRVQLFDRAGRYRDEWRDLYHPMDIFEDAAFADVLVSMRPEIPVGEGSGVAWVHASGAGVDALLAAHRDAPGGGWPEGVVLTRTTGRMGERIGEYCLARILAVTQRLGELEEDRTARRWRPVEAETLAGTRAVVVGTGAIGGAVACALAAAGCVVDGVSRSGRPREPFASVFPAARLADAIRDARWIVLAAPATEATHGLFGRDALAACRGDAYLVNVGRGSLVDEVALLDAVRSGSLRGAALDVFREEPLPPDSPLWDEPRIRISPHVAALTHPGETVEAFAAALASLRAGERPASAADPRAGY